MALWLIGRNRPDIRRALSTVFCIRGVFEDFRKAQSPGGCQMRCGIIHPLPSRAIHYWEG